MGASDYRVFAWFLFLSHFLCFLFSGMLLCRCDFKTPRLKKNLLRKSLVVWLPLNALLCFLCPQFAFPGRGFMGILRDIQAASFSYHDVFRLALSAFSCLLLSMLLTLLCCVLYRRWDDRIETTPRQRSLLLLVTAVALIPLIAAAMTGGSGTQGLRITDICRRYELRVIDEKTQEELPEDHSTVTISNTGVLKCDAGQVFLSVEPDDLKQVAVKGVSLLPGEEYTLDLMANESLMIKKSGGSTLYLSDEAGNILDQVAVPALKENEHYRKAGEEWQTVTVTPVTAAEALYTVPVPVFSAESGFYDDPFGLTLSAAPGLTIHYTLDCSEPDADSTVYTSPISVYDRSDEPNQYSRRPDMRNDYLETDVYQKKVQKCTVIRAVAVDAEGNMSPVVTKSYFIGDMPVDPQNTAVLSIVSAPDGLVGPEGILVTGIRFDEWYQKAVRNTLPGQAVDKKDAPKENFNQQGPEWERTANMQFFEQGKLLLDQPVGIRAQGHTSRNDRINKRLSIYSRKEYSGSSYFPAGLVNDFRQHSFVIRQGIFHAFCQLAFRDRDLATVDFIRTAFYLNGENFYTGYLLEKFNEKNMAEKYGLTETNVVIVPNGEASEDASLGSNPYTNVLSYIRNHDMAKDENFQEYDTIIDTQSLIDFLCANVYLANMDLTETRMNALQFHTVVPENNGFGDGRWRWGLIDMDVSWNNELTGVYRDTPWMLNGFTMTERGHTPIGQYEIYSGLKANPVFCRRFVLTFMDLANTVLDAENVLTLLEEVQSDDERFGPFFMQRREYALSHLAEEFSLIGTEETVTLSSNRSGAPVTLNTVTPELKNGQWSGGYFTDYSVTVTANGYGFDHWEVTADGRTETYTGSTIEVPVVKGGVQIHAVYQ